MARPPGKPDHCLIVLVAMVVTLAALAVGAVRVTAAIESPEQVEPRPAVMPGPPARTP